MVGTYSDFLVLAVDASGCWFIRVLAGSLIMQKRCTAELNHQDDRGADEAK